MMKYLLVIFSAFLLVKCTPEKNKDQSNPLKTKEEMELRLQAILDSMYLKAPKTKGIIMHVEAPDVQISWNAASGWADSTSHRKLQPNDPALIASITKMYLSASILRLVENGAIQLQQSISELLSEGRLNQLEEAGYDVNLITVAHLNSQTSGIFDYVNTVMYQNMTNLNPGHVWARDEQIELALTEQPLFAPGEKFAYSETNNLLLTEILERQTDKPFYLAMRDLLAYEKFGLKYTWFNWLEMAPKDVSPLVHQFATGYDVDSYSMHPSFDVYGGGGIAATAADVARFTQLLFSGEIFEKTETTELLFETIQTKDQIEGKYYMGIAQTKLGEYTAYGHGGFWGTTTQYFPELNASVSIFFMERDEWPKYLDMLEQVAEVLDQ